MTRRFLSVLPLAVSLAATSPVLAQTDVRFSTFNLSLNRDSAGQLVSDLSQPGLANPAGNTEARRIEQAQRNAEIIQRVNPDVLLLNEFDYVTGQGGNEAIDLFRTNFLAAPQNNIAGTTGSSAINFPHRFTAPSNTGIASGFDLNNNGNIVTTPGAAGYGDDSFGFGNYPGQFGMAFLSKFPIQSVRTFQNFLWKDMPNSLLIADPTPLGAGNNLSEFYSPAERDILRLSSKSHWDVTLNIDGTLVHALVSHPTPPVFDGTEDRNGKRNFDEIRFWKDYINGAGYMTDDQGVAGGLAAGSAFFIMGDQNADPFAGDAYTLNGVQAINQLLDDPLVDDGVAHRPDNNGGSLAEQPTPTPGDPQFDTADFNNAGPGNLRADYVLPSVAGIDPIDGEIFWLLPSDPLYGLTGSFGNPNLYSGFPTSDHRMTYVDVTVVPEPSTAALLLGAGAVLGLRRRLRRQH
ncbi:MAG: endonuclease/exonuclease/phosphatase family protein [Candidatus Saccharimonas sp.]|nr:endonuclease/exonuclease/phosphatase family protein [Planctomycetaceae bacterium]